jgi:hypothetical protein
MIRNQQVIGSSPIAGSIISAQNRVFGNVESCIPALTHKLTHYARKAAR